ncbi:MAG: hypothetical protein KR126chlam3_00322 [Chlamydiae bacterium]|nr:hypothetical protein [Chlamydiota bacterium]
MQKSLLALSIMSAANVAVAARGQDNCAPEPPATCYPENCNHCYCLGPENYGVNAPVRPVTCNGDWVISAAGLYWNAHQDGMEYAIETSVKNPDISEPVTSYIAINNLIDAEYKTPDFKWNWGFKVDFGYNTTCDGWDFGVIWTWYRGKANDHIETETDDNHTLLPLWSVSGSLIPTSSGQHVVLWATDIETQWKLELNLIDIELGREYWTSKYLSFRPFVGLRIAYLEQSFEIQHKGGSWSLSRLEIDDSNFNDKVDLDNDFKGVGVRAGFNTNWHFGCGWGLYGNFAASIVYGRFSLHHDEEIRLASAPFDKTKLLETEESFHASRAMLDFALGIQWASLFCDCQYGFTVQLGWEQHLFFHQNQLWRVNAIDFATNPPFLLEKRGENVFFQRRGTLDTQGWTLKVQFEF